MTAQFRLSPAAADDLVQIAAYLGERSPQAEAKFLDAVEECFKLLLESPTLGEVLPLSNPRLQRIRVRRIWGFEKYLVFYRATAKAVEVVRVLHGARDIAAIFDDD